MKKSYSHFTTDDLTDLGLTVVQDYLFKHVKSNAPSDWLLETFAFNQQIPMISEKARSELLITPILLEMRRKNPHTFTYFSGCPFNIDNQRGLKGFCDFIIAKPWNSAFIQSPVLAIVEAKHNQDLLDAIPQCSAEMYAAQLFNQDKKISLDVIYGAITNGYEWLFLTLNKHIIQVDIDRYMIKNLPELLGIWQLMIDDFCIKE